MTDDASIWFRKAVAFTFLAVTFALQVLATEVTVLGLSRGGHVLRDPAGSGELARLALLYASCYFLSALIGWSVITIGTLRGRGGPAPAILLAGLLAWPVVVGVLISPRSGSGAAVTWLTLAALAIAGVWWLARRRGSAGRGAGAAVAGAIVLVSGAVAPANTVALHDVDAFATASGLLRFSTAAVAGGVLAVPLAIAVSKLPTHRLRRRIRTLVLGAAVAAASGVAWITLASTLELESDSPGPTRGVTGGVPVLLVVVDTLRADHVPGYGLDPEQAPAMARLMRDSILVERTISTSPWTLPAFASILTGTYPAEHRAGLAGNRRKERPMSDHVRSLAEVLRERGYFTGATLTNPALRAETRLDKGFQVYENWAPLARGLPVADGLLKLLRRRALQYRRAAEQTERIWSLLERATSARAPFFILAHYMDPHVPYHAAPGEVAEGGPRVDLDYLAEVRYFDLHLGTLIDRLVAADLYDDLLIVFTSDHGEELMEGRGPGEERAHDHGHTLYRELLDVPLLIKLPRGVRGGERLTSPSSIVDIAATVLGRLEPSAVPEVPGVDLLSGELAGEPRILLGEAMLYGPEQKAAVLGDVKVVVPTMPPTRETALTFDLRADPMERQPGVLTESPDHERLFTALAAHATLSAAGAEEEVPLDPAMREQLKALGYVD